MNEARSRESCLTVRISPWPPKTTSWWATRPGSRTEWTRTPATSPPRTPATDSRPAGERSLAPPWAAAIALAVRSAVPEGASALPAWCSSITSADGKCRAAIVAKCMARTAPRVKFGAQTGWPPSSTGALGQFLKRPGGQAGGAGDQVDPAGQQGVGGGHGRLRRGEVDHHLDLGGDQVGQVVTDEQVPWCLGEHLAELVPDLGGARHHRGQLR